MSVVNQAIPVESKQMKLRVINKQGSMFTATPDAAFQIGRARVLSFPISVLTERQNRKLFRSELPVVIDVSWRRIGKYFGEGK